jgi:MFS family permease
MPEPHDPYAALRQRDFRLLLAGTVLASVGTQMASVAVGWELYDRTESAANLGYAGLVQFVPVLLLSFPAGQAADRYSRRGLLCAAQSLTALSALGLATLSYFRGPVGWMYVFLFLVGTGRAFSAPARWSLLPQVVPAAALTNAVTWNSGGWHLASVAGPALGGWAIYLSGGAAVTYVIAAGCALACAALVAAIRPRPRLRPKDPVALSSLIEGARFVWRNKLILATITLDLFAVLFGGATALYPIYARDILDVGAVGLGWLKAAAPLGALASAFVLAHRPPLRRAGRSLLGAVAGFGLATIAFGLSRDPLVSFACLALTGALDNVSVVVRGTLVQTLTPEWLRGRVSAVNAIFVGSSNELGEFESGITAAWFGPVASVVGGGVGTLVVVLAAALRWPEVLRLGALHQVRPAEGVTGQEVVPARPESP